MWCNEFINGCTTLFDEHDNARQHAVNAMKELLDSFRWNVLKHQGYTLCLSEAKHGWEKPLNRRGGRGEDEKVDEGVGRNYFEEGIQKLKLRLIIYIEKNGDVLNHHVFFSFFFLIQVFKAYNGSVHLHSKFLSKIVDGTAAEIYCDEPDLKRPFNPPHSY